MAGKRDEATLPIRAAGGGGPSEVVFARRIDSFAQGGHTLTQLRNVYGTLTRGQPFQELESLKDEESFLAYMSSPKAAATGPAPATTRDLSYPLSCYYISSSHNTYLSGNQLYGEVTTEAYKNVLLRGCRCLEIDIWDGEVDDSSASSSDEDYDPAAAAAAKAKPKASRWSRMKAKAVQIRRPSHSRERPSGLASSASPPSDPNKLSPSGSPEQALLRNEPRVLHGYTLTQSVPFRAVCKTIAEYAFVATDLPLIVSLEVHANLDQQQMMVEIMKETWKDHLINITEEDAKNLPSPDAVKKKILIKVKWTPDSQTGESNDPAALSAVTTENSTADSSEQKQKKATKVLKDLSKLGVYTRAYTFKNWNQPEAAIPTHVFSLSESKAHDMHADPSNGPAMFNHNRNFLMRVFPRGTRINSSNVDPVFHWHNGAQMVALNWQRVDKGMMLNEGMFAGQEGWVLKPEGYRSARLETDEDKKPHAAVTKKRLDFKIQLLSGQDIPIPLEKDMSQRSKIKPYVKIYLHTDTHGPPGQSSSNVSQPTSRTGAYPDDEKDDEVYEFRSQTQKSDSPNFDGETAAWSGIPDVIEQLSFIR
jgi:hypothetical protein